MVLTKVALFGEWSLEKVSWVLWSVIAVAFLSSFLAFQASGAPTYYAAFWGGIGFIITTIIALNAKRVSKHGVEYEAQVAVFRPFVFFLIFFISATSFISFVSFAVSATNPNIVEVSPFASAAGVVFIVSLVSFTLLSQMALAHSPMAQEGSDADTEKGNMLEDVVGEKRKMGPCRKYCAPVMWLLFAILGLLATFEAVGSTLSFTLSYPDESEFVVVNGRKVHYGCDGEYNDVYPPVMLEHGWGGSVYDMLRIRRMLSNTTRVCSYSRAGYGWSQVSSNPIRSSDAIADEIEEVIQALHGNRSVVMGGHSFAGHNMRLHQARNPDRVLGIVFVDALNADTSSRCGEEERNTEGLFLWDIGRRAVLPAGVLRVLLATVGIPMGGIIYELPEEVWSMYEIQLLSLKYFDLRYKEYELFPLSCSFVKGINDGEKKLDIPVVHLFGAEGIYKYSPENGQALANISTNGEYVLVEGEDSLHTELIFVEKFARQVSDKLLHVLEQVKTVDGEL